MLLLWLQFAFAANTCDVLHADLTCSSEFSDRITPTTPSNLDGSYACGDPFPALIQPGGEHIYRFRCQQDGVVELLLTNLDCDLDIYVLGDSCRPGADCVAGSTEAYETDDKVAFDCVLGADYYIVIEGWGYDTQGVGACRPDQGHYTLDFVSFGGCVEDCDDGLDNDLDGAADCLDDDCFDEAFCCDDDRDGHDDVGGVCGGDDCADRDPNIYPGMPERCDGVDQDCDGLIDEPEDLDASAPVWFIDADGDGWGAGAAIRSCVQPPGTSDRAGDCDDSDPAVNPDALEVCNGIDDQCDGLVDDDDPDREVEGTAVWYLDADLDGFGVAPPKVSCLAPDGWVGVDGDCDDTNPAVFPGANEVCNGVDDDCDALIDLEDPGLDRSTEVSWYLDLDQDGWGAGVSYTGCDAAGGSPRSGDCEDLNPAVFPGAMERCNGYDDDCDGLIDLADPDIDQAVGWADVDGDGFGDPQAVVVGCNGEPTADNALDCDDTDPDVGAPGPAWRDADGDGFGDPEVKVAQSCAVGGWVVDDADCDDADEQINPDADELCGGVDDDCDGKIDDEDDDLAETPPTWHPDQDRDGFGDPRESIVSCEAPTGWVLDDSDCDDSDWRTWPGAPELQDGLDNDCDGDGDDFVVPVDTAESGHTGGLPPLPVDEQPEIVWETPVGTARSGCRCAGVPGGGVGWLWTLPLLWWRRRR